MSVNANRKQTGGCGIVIKKQGSPVVMLLMMEFGRGENVTSLLLSVACACTPSLWPAPPFPPPCPLLRLPPLPLHHTLPLAPGPRTPPLRTCALFLPVHALPLLHPHQHTDSFACARTSFPLHPPRTHFLTPHPCTTTPPSPPPALVQVCGNDQDEIV